MDLQKRKSLLAIPVSSFTSKLNKLLHDEEFNCLKIPVFPRLPFGKHKDMIGNEPKFEILPKDTLINSESIKNLKLESGRIRKTVGPSFTSTIIRIKKRILTRKN